nr:magnesium and cobalt transport protein CorA [Brevibacterium daeguense]
MRPSREDLAELAARFDLHPLAVEDAAEAHQRPKYEHYGTTDFVVLRPAEAAPTPSESDVARDPAIIDVRVGELHVFVGAAFVILVAHTDSVDLPAVRRAFERDPRFLEFPQLSALYRIMDEVVDGYEPLLSALEDYGDSLEERIFGTGPVPSRDVYYLSRELIELGRAVNPLGGLAASLHVSLDRHRPPEDLLRGMRDVTDHIHTAIERLERLRTVVREIFSVNATLIAERQNDDMRQLNELSIQQNEQMKKISAWAGIFFFPSLIAGAYGMNFKHMPELHWLLGYPFALGLMLSGSLLLYLVFKRVGWL